MHKNVNKGKMFELMHLTIGLSWL